MFKVQISNRIIEDEDLSNYAFYLYVYLKLYAHGNKTIYIYRDDLQEILEWKDKKTLKKYLNELDDSKYIKIEWKINSKGQASFPINRPIKIDIVDKYNIEQFTQINEDIIIEIKNIAKKTEIHKMIDGEWIIEHVYDEKEPATRIYYLYEKNYHKKDKYAMRLSYDEISKITKCGNKIIKSINTLFIKHDLLIVDTGKRKPDSLQRTRNRYLPIWEENRKKEHYDLIKSIYANSNKKGGKTK